MHSHVRFNRGLVRQYHKRMKAMHYAGTTQTTYLKALHQYVGFMGQRSLARAKHTDIQLFIAQASENGATLGSVYRHLGILRQFYDFLNLGGVVDYVAPRFVRLRLPWHQRPRVLSEAQVRQLISATRTPRERALIEFFYSTGCRLNEARHIKIENIDFVPRQARVRGKLGKLRLVLLAESASTAVRNYIGNRTIGYGCLICGTESGYHSNGLCHRCYGRTRKKVLFSTRRHAGRKRKGRLDLELFRQQKLARNLLSRYASQGAISPKPRSVQVAQNNPVYEALAAKLEPSRRSE